MKTTGVIAFLLLLVGTANAETFDCQEGWFWVDDYEVIVIATINEDEETGAITVSGFTHSTVYNVEGFDRVWRFGPQDDDSFNYAFVLQPDGTGLYYDFSSIEVGESAQASQTFTCQERSTKVDSGQ